MAEETIMICLDMSKWMSRSWSDGYWLQIECARSYCRAKLKSNPKNAIGIMTMGTRDTEYLSPTSDLDKILCKLHLNFILGGELDFLRKIGCSVRDLLRDKPSNCKRLLLFTGGPTDLDLPKAQYFGEGLKEADVAVDVVNLCRDTQDCYWKGPLDAFVAAVNNNNNSRIMHFQTKQLIKRRMRPHLPFKRICDVLSSTPEFIPLALLKEGEIARKQELAKDPEGEDSKIHAAARDAYVEDKENEKPQGMERGEHNPQEL